MRKLEKEDMKIVDEEITKDMTKNKERYSKTRYEEKFTDYVKEHGEELDCVKYYLNNCFPFGENMNIYENGGLVVIKKSVFENEINKKFDKILKIYVNRIDIRNYIETVEPNREERFYKDGENRYINKFEKGKFKLNKEYVLDDDQKDFLKDFEEKFLPSLAGECQEGDLKKGNNI